jgi:hypothetical protein
VQAGQLCWSAWDPLPANAPTSRERKAVTESVSPPCFAAWASSKLMPLQCRHVREPSASIRRTPTCARDDRDQQSSPWPGTEGSNPAPSAGPGPLTLIEGNASGSVRVYDSASLSLDRRASHAVWPRCRLFPLKRVRSVKAKAMGFSVRRQYVRYTAIARRPAAQGKSTARSARGTSATPNKPPLASWGAGALAGAQRCFSPRSR